MRKYCTDRTVVVTANTAWNIYNFRRPLIDALIAAGHSVTVMAPSDRYSRRLRSLGYNVVPIVLKASGINPLYEASAAWSFIKVFLTKRPMVALAFTIKPNLYSGLAGAVSRTPVVNNVSGLGTVFIRRGPLTVLAKNLYRALLDRSTMVFCQNGDDMRLLRDRRIIPNAPMERIPGSGVDTEKFKPVRRDAKNTRFTFLFVGRLIWEKGIAEFVEAARMLHKRGVDARFVILGQMMTGKRAVSMRELASWIAEGCVEYAGFTDDVKPHLQVADCVVLPSYREGLARSLLEAASMGIPLIATNVPGCRDVVRNGCNGYIVSHHNAADLSAKMEKMLRTAPEERSRMGKSGRSMVVNEYSESTVIARYLQVVDSIDTRRRS